VIGVIESPAVQTLPIHSCVRASTSPPQADVRTVAAEARGSSRTTLNLGMSMNVQWQDPKAVAREAALLAGSWAFVAVVAFGVAGSLNALFAAITLTAGVASVLVRWLFPKRAFFSLTFANLIAVYAAVFAFFMEQVFGTVPSATAGFGFSLPVAAFLCGCLIWRESIGFLVDNPSLRDSRSLFSSASWLLPVSAVGVTVLLLSLHPTAAVDTSFAFLAAMALIAGIVFSVSRSVVVFLVDAGLLFDEFFQRMSRLAIPAFALIGIAGRRPAYLEKLIKTKALGPLTYYLATMKRQPVGRWPAFLGAKFWPDREYLVNKFGSASRLRYLRQFIRKFRT